MGCISRVWILRELSSVFWGFIHLKQVSPSPLKSQKEPQYPPSQKKPKTTTATAKPLLAYNFLCPQRSWPGSLWDRCIPAPQLRSPGPTCAGSGECRTPWTEGLKGWPGTERSATHHRFNHLPALQFTQAPRAWGLASILHFSYLDFCCSKHFLQWPQTWQKENCFLNSDKVMPPRETWWYCSSLCQNRFWA